MSPRVSGGDLVPNQVRPSDILIVGARITEDVLSAVRVVEQAFAAAIVLAIRAEGGPCLGLATTAELLAEIAERIDADAVKTIDADIRAARGGVPA